MLLHSDKICMNCTMLMRVWMRVCVFAFITDNGIYTFYVISFLLGKITASILQKKIIVYEIIKRISRIEILRMERYASYRNPYANNLYLILCVYAFIWTCLHWRRVHTKRKTRRTVYIHKGKGSNVIETNKFY